MSSIIHVIRVLLVVSFAVMGHVTAEGEYKNIVDFLNVFNGVYDNKAQYECRGESHDHIQARFVPVLTSNQLHGLFIEESLNGVVVLLYLGVITRATETNLFLQLYNLTDGRQYTPIEYDVNSLDQLTIENLDGDPDCVAKYVLIDTATYSGTFANCQAVVDGRHPVYIHTLGCDSVVAYVPSGAKEQSAIDPYELLRTGEKYQVPNSPEDYTSVCPANLK